MDFSTNEEYKVFFFLTFLIFENSPSILKSRQMSKKRIFYILSNGKIKKREYMACSLNLKNGRSRTLCILKYGKTPIQEHGAFLNLKNPRSENTPDQYSLSTVELRRNLRYIYSVTG